jgi:hypothetical protein
MYETQATYSHKKQPWSLTSRLPNRPNLRISHHTMHKIELREGGGQGQSLSYHLPLYLPQPIAT